MAQLLYCPLESYSDRYTSQLAAPGTGWNEANWRAAGVAYDRVDSPFGFHHSRPVAGDGPVIDTCRRAGHCFQQVMDLLRRLDRGEVTDDTVVFLDDFWTPGVEQFFLACDLKGVRPRVFAQLWAQSCDQYDFTRPSRAWIRHVERGYLERMSGVFVACPSLKYQVDTGYGQLGRPRSGSKVHVVGLPFRSADVLFHNSAGSPFPENGELLSQAKKGNKLVVWSSRLDREKNPYMLAEVARTVLKYHDPDVHFVVCTGQPELRGDQGQIDLIRQCQQDFPGRVHFRTGLSKADYYTVLRQARVQLNAASQDWVSFTLLEASAAGCWPVYPRFRSFPETFLGRAEFMYDKDDYEAAARTVAEAVNDDARFTPDAIRSRAWVHERFDSTWARQAAVMFGQHRFRYDPRCCANPFDIAQVRAHWPEAGL